MPFTLNDINNKKPGNSRITVIGFAERYVTPKGAKYTRVICHCECGTEFTTLMASVIKGATISCGCYHQEIRHKKGFTIEEVNNRKPIGSRLTALEYVESHTTPKGVKIKRIKVKCSCGKITTVRQADMLWGHTLSCGCYEAEVLLKRNTKFSHHIPKIYQCWHCMIKRCYNSKDQQYKNYGGRGVTVCDEWRNDYQSFLDWAIDKWQPGLQIDKDIIGNGLLYSPATCCFVTRDENVNNRACSIKFPYKDSTFSLPQISRMSGIGFNKLRKRVVEYKLSIEDAISLGNKKTNKWETKKYRNKIGV